MKVNSVHLAIAKIAHNTFPHMNLRAVCVEPGGILVATNGKILVELKVDGEEKSTLEGTLDAHDVLAARSLQIEADIERHAIVEGECPNCGDSDLECELCCDAPLEFRITPGEAGALNLTTIRDRPGAGQLTMSSPRVSFPSKWREQTNATTEPKAHALLSVEFLMGLLEVVKATGGSRVELFMRGPHEALEFRWELNGQYRALLMPMLPRDAVEEARAAGARVLTEQRSATSTITSATDRGA